MRGRRRRRPKDKFIGPDGSGPRTTCARRMLPILGGFALGFLAVVPALVHPVARPLIFDAHKAVSGPCGPLSRKPVFLPEPVSSPCRLLSRVASVSGVSREESTAGLSPSGASLARNALQPPRRRLRSLFPKMPHAINAEVDCYYDLERLSSSEQHGDREEREISDCAQADEEGNKAFGGVSASRYRGTIDLSRLRQAPKPEKIHRGERCQGESLRHLPSHRQIGRAHV